MRKVWRALWIFLVLGYLACLRFVFAAHDLAPIQVDSVPVDGNISKIYGNGNLECLLVFLSGGAAFVEATDQIKRTPIDLAKGAGRFTMGALTQRGTIFLLDDRNVLYRSPRARTVFTSKPLHLGGEILSFAVEEDKGIAWFAVRRSEPHDGDLFVLTLSLSNGKVLKSTNLGPQGSNVTFSTSPSGQIVALTTTSTPGVFLFDYLDKEVVSRYVPTVDLVTVVAFDSLQPLLGLRTGEVLALDPKTWEVKAKYETNLFPVSFLAAFDSKIAIGHAGQNPTAQIGSFQEVGTIDGEAEGQCSANSMVTAGAAAQGSSSTIYGLQSGAMRIYSDKDGCQAVEMPTKDRPGRIAFIASKWPICMVVGENQIQRIQFK